MRILARIKDRLIRREYSRISHYLETAEPQKLAESSGRSALKAFHRAAQGSPAYKNILRQRGVEPKDIVTLDDFQQRVPIVDKDTMFADNELRDLCADRKLDDIALFYSSSGHSGTFSFGVETRSESTRVAQMLEFSLSDKFDALNKKTLLINCLPMGVKVHTRTIPLAETSVRQDVIWALVKKLRNEFDQFILIGGHIFLKRVIEDGADHGVPWKDTVVHVATGMEYIAENYRRYLASLLGTDGLSLDTGRIMVNFGLSELSTSIFTDTPETVRIRQLAQADADFRRTLYGQNTRACPSIMQWYPSQSFIETTPGLDGTNELVVTMLDATRRMPMIRYNTRDIVEVMTYNEMSKILNDFGQQSLLPRFHLPIGIIWGKHQTFETTDGQTISPEQIKEAIYSDYEIAGMITGIFRLQREDTKAVLMMQLRKGEDPTQAKIEKLTHCLREFGVVGVEVRLLSYWEYPYGLEHDFERKNQHM